MLAESETIDTSAGGYSESVGWHGYPGRLLHQCFPLGERFDYVGFYGASEAGRGGLVQVQLPYGTVAPASPVPASSWVCEKKAL